MKRMNSASGLPKIFWPLWIPTELRGAHTVHEGGNYQAALRVWVLCLEQGWEHGWQSWDCAQSSVFVWQNDSYWIFSQVWEFALPFFLQRLSLLSLCECFFWFNSQEIKSLQGLEPDCCLPLNLDKWSCSSCPQLSALLHTAEGKRW